MSRTSMLTVTRVGLPLSIFRGVCLYSMHLSHPHCFHHESCSSCMLLHQGPASIVERCRKCSHNIEGL